MEIAKTDLASGSAISMDIPDEFSASIDSVEGIEEPYTACVSDSMIVVCCSGEDKDLISSPTLSGKITVACKVDSDKVERGSSFDLAINTKDNEHNKSHKITYKKPVDFITDVVIQNMDGEDIENSEVGKDSSIVVKYLFNCSDGNSMEDFSIALPSEIAIDTDCSKDLIFEDMLLCKASVSKVKKEVAFDFTDAIKEYKDITGTFEFGLKFDKNAIGKAKTKDLIFDLGNGKLLHFYNYY